MRNKKSPSATGASDRVDVVTDVGVGADSSPMLTRRGQRTRAALIQAAREIFEETGFRNARVADIAARAGVSYGSFYTYFDTTGHVFREVVKEVTGTMFASTVRPDLPSAGPVERIGLANRQYLGAYRRNARIMAVIEEVAPYSDYSRELLKSMRVMFLNRNESGIRRLQASGQADATLDPALAANALGGMVEQFARTSELFGQQYDEDLAISTLTRIWAQGIGLQTD